MIPERLSALIDRYAPEVDALRDGAYARARCYQESRRFADYLAGHGFDAEPWGAWADELGFKQRCATPWLQDDSHVVCVVRLDDRTFTVDWTASQYGHDAFPLVREVDELPARDPWLLTREQADEFMRHAKVWLEQQATVAPSAPPRR